MEFAKKFVKGAWKYYASGKMVCGKSPQHGALKNIVLQAHAEQKKPTLQKETQPMLFRTDANSMRFATAEKVDKK